MPYTNSFHSKSIQIKGRKNSGKTTLLEMLTKRLTESGLKVGTYKTSPHNHPVDRENTDSDRLRKSGAFPSAFQSPDGLALFYNGAGLDDDTNHGLLVDAYRNCDVVLVESYTGNYGPVIVLSDSTDISPGDDVMFVVNRNGEHDRYRAFRPDDERMIEVVKTFCSRSTNQNTN